MHPLAICCILIMLFSYRDSCLTLQQAIEASKGTLLIKHRIFPAADPQSSKSTTSVSKVPDTSQQSAEKTQVDPEHTGASPSVKTTRALTSHSLIMPGHTLSVVPVGISLSSEQDASSSCARMNGNSSCIPAENLTCQAGGKLIGKGVMQENVSTVESLQHSQISGHNASQESLQHLRISERDASKKNSGNMVMASNPKDSSTLFVKVDPLTNSFCY